MNTKQLFAAAAIALVGTTSAFAQDAEQHVPTGSQLTRAEVKAEVQRARDAGELIVASETALNATQPVKATSGLTRAEVRAEVLKAQADGSLARAAELDGNFAAAPAPTNTAAARTREEVRAEAIAYTRERNRAGRVESYLQ